MALENLNDIDQYEQDLIKRKKESTKEEKKNNPFAQKKSFDFGKNFSKDSLKNVNIKELIFSKLNINTVLWSILIIFVIYSYNTEVFKKVEEIPTLKTNLSILEDNIKKQNQELASLEEINLDSSSLEEKENLLDLHLPEEHENLNIEQTNTIYEVAKKVGLEIDSLQKIEVKRDDRKIEDFYLQLEGTDIENFYENAWYTKFIISTMSSEEVIFRFKEKIEDEVEFLFDGFSLNQSDGEVKYSFSVTAIYNLKDIQDE